tara:strand:+ start:3953 stop:4570 length:618 start_codon:yes stop_codon:yes gene_type:complete
MNPDVSIIITNYNYEKFIARCVRSCLSQKNVNAEVIVVDDFSDTSVDNILKPFGTNVTLIKNKTNLGVAESSNVGLRSSKAQFVIRVDADDFVNSDMCYFMKTYLESNHDAFCVSCDYNLVDEHENFIQRKYASIENISCGIMYRKDQLMQFGGYKPDQRHREEEELRKRLGDYYKIHHLQIPFYRYRMHNTNKTKLPEYKTTKI